MIKNRIRRALSLILATLMLSATIVGGASATSSNTITIGTISGSPGESVSVPVSISLAEASTGMGFTIEYDSANLTLESTTLNTALVTNSQHGENLAYSSNSARFLINWVAAPKTASGVLFNLNFVVKNSAGANGTYPVRFLSNANRMVTDLSLIHI